MKQSIPWPNGTRIRHAMFGSGAVVISEKNTEATIRGHTHWDGTLWYVLQGEESDLLFIRPSEACVIGTENNVENRAKLVEAMYDAAFEEDKKYAYIEHHMDSLEQLTEQEFNAHWQEVIS